MASSPPSSSSSSSARLYDAVAKSLEAAAERQAHSFILPSTYEEAIPPITPLPHDNKGKRKMSQLFDETPYVSTELCLGVAGPPTFKHTKSAAAGPSTSTALSPSLMLSAQLFHAQFDEGKGKMPQFFDFFASVPPSPRVVVVSQNSPALPEDHWQIKKVLKTSDVDDSSRLLLAKFDVQKYILPHVMGNGPGLYEGQGVEVTVQDVDTGSEHALVLTKWRTGSFVLKKSWVSDFVRRRGLEKNDEIGLRWNDAKSKLEFTVLKKK